VLARAAQPPVQRGFSAAIAEEDWRQFDFARQHSPGCAIQRVICLKAQGVSGRMKVYEQESMAIYGAKMLCKRSS
jgi:hypothetical protein